MPVKVVLHHSNYERHSFQIHTGFKMLCNSNKIELSVVNKADPIYKRKTLPINKVVIDGKVIIYDTLDGYRFDHNLDVENNLKLLDSVLDNCDYYFKRSYCVNLISKLRNKNIHPLGLYYPMYNLLIKGYHEYKLGSKMFLKSLIEHNKVLSKMCNVPYYKELYPESISCLPLSLSDYRYKNSVLYLARAWDPYEEHLPDDLVQERIRINEQRAACIRQCKKSFGDVFFGGFEESEFTNKNYRDLVVPSFVTAKSNYLRTMKQASICIATAGLHNSIGSKFGEYVACSKAIISDELYYQVDDEFKEGVNYVTFKELDEIPAIIQAFLDNPSSVTNMMNANHQYYNNFLRPDKLILRSLIKSGVLNGDDYGN